MMTPSDSPMDLPLESVMIPAATLGAEQASRAMELIEGARARLTRLETQAAALRLARLFHESPELLWFRFYKNISETESHINARLLCNLWESDDSSLPEALLVKEDDLFEEDSEAEQERLMLASLHRDLEAWCESLSAEAFDSLASTLFERPAAAGEGALAERFLRQCLGDEGYAAWERVKLAHEAGLGLAQSPQPPARSL